MFLNRKVLALQAEAMLELLSEREYSVWEYLPLMEQELSGRLRTNWKNPNILLRHHS
jgi:hypothetical protein